VSNKIDKLIIEAALQLAQKLTPKKPQGVVFKIQDDPDVFKILWGIPMDSHRHGIGDVGHLQLPTKKIAILDAINENRPIIIDDAINDHRVEYMREHVKSKDILSLAVIPIMRDESVDWLIIMDKVEPAKKGFTSTEVVQIEKCKKHLEKSISNISNVLNGHIESMLSDYADVLRNQLPPLSGLARKIIKTENLAEAKTQAALMNEVILKLEKELVSYFSLADCIAENHKKQKVKVSEILAGAENAFEISADPAVMSKKVFVNQDVMKIFFFEFGSYLKRSGGQEGLPIVNIESETFNIVLRIKNKAFGEFKESTDSRLSLLKSVIVGQNGDMNIKTELCTIALPRSKY
jgi:hypothetical protein